MNEIKELLKNEIMSGMEELANTQFGTSEYGDIEKCLNNLMDELIEIEKVENETFENENFKTKELELKTKEIMIKKEYDDKNLKIKLIEICIGVGTFGLGLMYKIRTRDKSFAFDKSDNITSTVGRSIFPSIFRFKD